MSCHHTRQDVSDIVVGVIRGIEEDRTITENSVFGTDIIVDKKYKRLYAFPIKRSVEIYPLCMLKKFGPDQCEKAKKVGDIVDAVWKEFKPK
jgi:hypothetical protein